MISPAMLLPGDVSALRRYVTQWCDDADIAPNVVAEVDDMAILQLLDHDGAGGFCAPSVVAVLAIADAARRRLAAMRRKRG